MGRRAAGIGSLVAGGLLAGVARRRFTRFEIAETSMEPALSPGDYVLATAQRHVPTRGSIVILRPPLAPFDLVKRVVGLPGEAVEIGGGHVAVDGRILLEPWADGPTHPAGKWFVGPDEVFVLGDRRARSAGDSRDTGPVALSSVDHRVVFRYRPVRAMARL